MLCYACFCLGWAVAELVAVLKHPSSLIELTGRPVSSVLDSYSMKEANKIFNEMKESENKA